MGRGIRHAALPEEAGWVIINAVQFPDNQQDTGMGTKERRQREAARRRKTILDAARTLFWEKGYGSTTVPQIAAAAELAPGTLYLYFPGKSALYVELLHEGYEMLRQRLAAHVARGVAPERQGGELIDVFFDFARECGQYFDIIFFLLRRDVPGGRESQLEPEQAQRLHAWENSCKDLVAQVLTEYGFQPPAGDLASAVEAIWSMLAGVVFFFNRQDKFEPIAREAKALMLKAVFGR